MAEKIYIRNASGEIEPLAEERFETEAMLEELIAQHPELLAGEQMRPEDPLRWVLIKPQMQIEGWAVDLLLVDQHARPTLVEVKRGTNPDNRRKVVGQMLDYAATASSVWSERDLRQVFEKSHEEPDEVIVDLLQSDDEPAVDTFWENVATNLEANRLRLLFVADEIPTELERVVRFLNEQTRDNLEVLAVEIKQYPGQFGKALVSRIIGQAEASQRGGIRQSNMVTLEEFLDALPPDVREASQKLVNDARDAGGIIRPSARGIRVQGRCRHHTLPIAVAQFYEPTNDRPEGEFDFRVRSDYSNQELQQFLLDWVKSFECGIPADKFTRVNYLTGWTVQAAAVSQHVDLLSERLKDVLIRLKEL